ncbi:peptidase M23 [Citricoccus sp. SGAir0253]|uniref:M23 family metallopeptidase n=1 Tax=Citricoccus sp. SGAir0253 TaxID=2567881 RepID=UPI0010CCD01B|nr:M23 family metallopeptidase [Citricoccus sp. SGAir0253]QCU78455.1 peptidase M23 [Citricoccus sp. SGAir0253]
MSRGRLSRAILGAGLVTVLSLSLGGTAAAQDGIDDLERQIEQAEEERERLQGQLGDLGGRQSTLEDRQGDLDAALEGLDEDITAKIRELDRLQGELPAAQEALATAEGRVSAAVAEVSSLTERVQRAEAGRSEILAEIERSDRELDAARDEIGQIANQAYKQGGVSSELAFMLGLSDSSLPDAVGLAHQALRIQDGRISSVAQERSTDVDAETRLAAVEGEIRDLRAEAERALEREQQARDEAAGAKAELDRMVSATSRLTDELKAQRPAIQRQLDKNRAAQERVNDQIAERQRELTAESERQGDLRQQHRAAVAEAERKRREAEEAARRAREAQAAAERAAAAQAAARQAAAEREAAAEAAAQRAAAERARAAADRAARAADAADERARQAQRGAARASSGWGLQLPVDTYMTSGFGWRATPAGTFDYGGSGGYVHTGIDFGGGCGIPVRAAAAGEVWNADWAVWTSGNRVVVSHGVVNGRALATKYHHLTRSVVSPGQRVERGQVIGYTGSTGNSTGCHLHFETILDGQAVDPLGLY